MAGPALSVFSLLSACFIYSLFLDSYFMSTGSFSQVSLLSSDDFHLLSFSPWVLETLMMMGFNSLIYSLISHSSWQGSEPFRAGVRDFSVPRDAGAAVNHRPNSRAHTGSTLEIHRTASPWVRWYFQIEICDFFPGQSFPWDILEELEVFFSSFRIVSSEHRDRDSDVYLVTNLPKSG